MDEAPHAASPSPTGPSALSSRKQEQFLSVIRDGRRAVLDPGWDDVTLVPRALPVGSVGSVDLTTEFLGHRLAAPIVVAGMTGGFVGAEAVNAALGRAAEELGVAVGVGSQRAALVDPALERTFSAIRRHAPNAVVIANVGVGQLVEGSASRFGATEIRRAVDMIGADALAIHLNLVQELVQDEGDRHFEGVADAIAEVVASSPVPVVVKETGSGLDRRSAAALVACGVAALDVGGAGGTSFVRVEAERGGDRATRLGEVFAGWGIPTTCSILEARHLGVPVIATGGVRSGLDAARALALGADLVGVGRPAAQAATRGASAVVAHLGTLVEELRMALVLSGALVPAELEPPVLGGATLEWARQRPPT